MVGSLVEDRSARLERARALLGASRWAPLGAPRGPSHTRPELSEPGAARSRRGPLPVAGPLRPLLPGGVLRRGGTVAVDHSAALVLALLAEASADGAWCALVGLPEIGLVAAEEAGLELSRLALVADPGLELVGVTAALLDGLDLVVVAGGERIPAGARQRLAARARQAGSVLLPVGSWPGADVRLAVEGGRWLGLAGAGAGRLRCRRVRLRGGGRGAAHRERSVEVLLPGPDGRAVAISARSGVLPERRAGSPMSGDGLPVRAGEPAAPAREAS